MEKYRAVYHSNGYPCGWEKMGLNNVSLMSASAVSENISEEMSPAISESNHLMGRTNLSKMDVLIYFWAWQMEWIRGSWKTETKKVEAEENNRQEKIKTSLSRFIQRRSMPAMSVCGLSADTDRNFNYLIREGKWKDLSVVISAVFHRSI